MRRKSSWPQLCSQKDRANGCLEQMAAKMYVNLRPPGLLPAYGGHAALLEGVGPRAQCRVTLHHSILRSIWRHAMPQTTDEVVGEKQEF